MSTSGLRNLAIGTFIISMAILLWAGTLPRTRCRPFHSASPAAAPLVTDDDAILRGQDVYQRYGLMDHGSVWGHGTLRGMDFCGRHTALHG